MYFKKYKNYWLFCILSPSFFINPLVILLPSEILIEYKTSYKLILFICFLFFINLGYINLLKLKKTDLLLPFQFLILVTMSNYFIQYDKALIFYGFFNLIIFIFLKNKLKYLIGYCIYLFFTFLGFMSLFIIGFLTYVKF